MRKRRAESAATAVATVTATTVVSVATVSASVAAESRLTVATTQDSYSVRSDKVPLVSPKRRRVEGSDSDQQTVGLI